MRREPRKLNDRFLKALSPAKHGDRDEWPDTLEPGLIARVTDKGTITFCLVERFPGSNNPTRRALGEYSVWSQADQQAAAREFDQLHRDPDRPTFEQFLLRTYGATTLAGAREKARQWKALISRGIDPRSEEERERHAEQQKRANTFAAVAEDFIEDKLPGERKGAEVERDIRRELLPVWGKRPVTEIADLDVLAVIRAKKRTAPAQARNLLGIVKRLFAWAVDQRCYGLRTSPADGLKPTKIVGEKQSGDRVLDDDELFALWRAAKRTPYPYGPVYQVLMLTALRLNEAADASWSEFDSGARIWVIAKERMKGKNSKARPHAVPLTDDVLSIVNGLPRFKGGDFLFSTTHGKSSVWMSDKIKKRLDARILRTLRALARRRGEDPAKVALPRWTNHDIRRSVRSQLSRLKITEEAREAVLAHVRPGIKGTYDLHDYLDEKREALELWGKRLRGIVEPSTKDNVVALRA
jgi:integrase